tara:strand:- start:376 stop:654 length:279 start_codon:yes stop_codon:yes gene_type:complete
MKKVNKIFNIIFGYIIFAVAMGIGMSYLTEYLADTNWFGDVIEIRRYTNVEEYEYVKWGMRHIWYSAGLWLVSFTTLIRVMVVIIDIAGSDS